MAKKKRKNTQKQRMSRRESRIQRRQAKRKRQQFTTYAVLGLVAVAIIAFFLWPRPEAVSVAQARLDDNPSLGPADAPVTLTELGDFTCSSCRAWHQAGVLQQIMNQYGDLVRIEWRDFPIITADSPRAAEAGQCAYDQGQFWAYLDRVYNEPGSSYTNGTESKLRLYAEEISLDMAAFNTCLDTRQHQATVEYDLDFARELGLRGTPSFLVNGRPIIGGDPQLLIQAIDQELASQ